MTRLEIPLFREDTCDYLRVSAFASIGAAEYTDLKALLGLADELVRVSSHRLSNVSDLGMVGLQETLTIHPVSPGDAVEEATMMNEDDLSYPNASDIAAHVHLELLTEFVAAGSEEWDESNHLLSQTLDWLRNRGDVPIQVIARRSFDTQKFESLIPFPTAIKPFTSVSGITLVKEADSTSPGALAYEVDLRHWKDSMGASIRFRSKLPSGVDALDRLLESASEIASFAVQRRLREETR